MSNIELRLLVSPQFIGYTQTSMLGAFIRVSKGSDQGKIQVFEDEI